MHYYQHHVGDYRRDTSSLSLVEHGVYLCLMAEYYVTERPLPSDLATLYRICRAVSKPERDAVATVIERFFQLDGMVLKHKRIEAELDDYRKKAKDASNAGKASAAARQKKKAQQGSNGTATVVEQSLNDRTNETATNQEPETNNHLGSSDEGEMPSLKLVCQWAESLMAPVECAEVWWNEMEGVGWIDARGRPVRQARPVFTAYATKWKANDQRSKLHAHKPAHQPTPPTPCVNKPGRYT
jgi:uncharacterized protein YdaU (DUF1376 family)